VTPSNDAWVAKKPATGSEDPRKYLQISFLFGHAHLWKIVSHKWVEKIIIKISRF